ncbi:MAG TPA: o-succinylbenzoate synthase [Salinimicrobium sp.]|nr:o-succinylbenzoate synthase [Salinimicrobium sp.]
MKASFQKHILNFKIPSGTSRGILTQKESWFLILEENGKKGIGECGILRGLSIDDRPDYEKKLEWTSKNVHLGEKNLLKELEEFPSIQFGVEMAFRSLNSATPFELFPSEFTRGEESIPINGLVWMGEPSFMKKQIREKINSGFSCIKLKIGAISFETEIELLKGIRKEFSSDDIEIRVDANGAFSASEAMEKLKILHDFQLHSIEQPIKQGQMEEMAEICEKSPLPVALDEELIGIMDVTEKQKLLQMIKPQYLIFKPSLLGGMHATEEWLKLAEQQQVGWWVTSALESNIGLNAIAQFTFHLLKKYRKMPFLDNNKNNFSGEIMPQGLGTGSLYTNNFDSPLRVENGKLHYQTQNHWNFNL